MDQWLSNSAAHNVDVWVHDTAVGVNIRIREYFQYFDGRGLDVVDEGDEWVSVRGIDVAEAKRIYTACYDVDEWCQCPELLNKFIKIPCDFETLENYKASTVRGEFILPEALVQLQSIMQGGGRWFVRTSGCSPKDNMQLDRSVGQQISASEDAKKIFFTVATSSRCMDRISSEGVCNLWVAKFQDLGEYTHYRIFVRMGKVRAISQYDTFPPPENVEQVRRDILALWDRVGDHVWYEDCTMDVVHKHDDIKIVEFNEFGISSNCGSANYNWIQDALILYYGDADIRVNIDIY